MKTTADFQWKNSSLESSLEQLRATGVYNVVFGVGRFSDFLLSACDELQIPLAAFCDNSPDAAERAPAGVPVYTPEQAVGLGDQVNFIVSLIHAPYIDEAVAQLRGLGKVECFDGQLTNLTIRKRETIPYQVRIYRQVHGKYRPEPSRADILPPTPPQWEELPEAIRLAFTMDNRILLQHMYLDDRQSSSIRIVPETYAKTFQALENRSFTYYANAMTYFFDSMEAYPLAGKTILIYGLTHCNCEAFAVWSGAARVIVVDYNLPICCHDLVECMTHEELKARDIRADAAISFSSFEHDGLGRYGDPIAPDGDLSAMRHAAETVKPGGLLFLGVPIGDDSLYWNGMRRYGPLRLPMLLEGWDCLCVYGTLSDPSGHLLLILRNAPDGEMSQSAMEKQITSIHGGSDHPATDSENPAFLAEVLKYKLAHREACGDR